jgi:Tfp pilus assembly protein PilE
MSTLVMVLIAIILAVVIYVIYTTYFSKNKRLTSGAYLGAGKNTVPNTKIVNQESTTFNYSMWVYVNSWPASASSASSYNLIRMVSGSKSYFGIQLKKISGTSPQLELRINDNSPITITNKFPIQKWCYVVVNVSDSKTCDSYLDGKLVSSQQISYTSPNNQETDPAVTIEMGDDSNPDIYLGNVFRNTKYVSPAKVWKNYSSTSVPTSSSVIPSYNVQFNLYNYGQLQSQKSLF